MDRQLDERHAYCDLPEANRQTLYSPSRLAAAVNELKRLTEDRLFKAIERVLADLDNAAARTSAEIEAAHRLRMWRADYLRLAAELDAAAHSFRLIERGLGQRIDATLAGWEGRFEADNQGNIRPPSGTGRDGALGGRFHMARTQAPLATTPEEGALTPDVALARLLAPAISEAHNADIAARVLGPLELSVAGAQVSRWKSLKARAVFQYLLIHEARPVRREVLMQLEWPDHSHNSARNNLNVALYSLRNTLDPQGLDMQVILHKEGCYLLNPELTIWIDRNEFLSALYDGQVARQVGHTQRAIDACQRAVKLYRGPLFEDDLSGEWYLPEQRQLKEKYLQALECLAETHWDLGQLPTAIEFGQLAISTDPCCEPVHRLLMRCYASQHQQQLVSRQFRLCATALQDELGVSPATETVQLFRTLTS